MPKPLKVFLGVSGAMTAIFSAMMVVVFAVDIAHGGDGKTTLGVLWGLVVFFSLSGAGGVWLAKVTLLAPDRPPLEPLSEFEQEQRILSLAESSAGRVTVHEVAARCRLSIKDSKAALLRLATQGAAELHLTENGVEVYAFPGFLPAAIKAAAQDPLDPQLE